MPVAGENETYTKEQVDAMIAERVATEVDGLKRNRDELAKEAKAAKAKAAAYEGFDPDEYKRLKTSAEEAEQKRLTAEGDFTKLREQLVNKHNTELGAKDKRISKFESALNRRLTTDELRKALTGKALPEYQDLLVEHGAKYLQLRETDDDFDYVITDGKGNPVIANGQGAPMTMDLFVEQTLKSKYPSAFQGTGSSGGGATKSTGGASGSATPPGTIARGDQRAFMANLDAIAKGKVEVV